jgi:hypothetical protein
MERIAMSKKRMTTPKGTASWPKLNEPDTKFDAKGLYSVQLRIPQAEAAKLMAELTSMYDGYYAEQVREAKKKLKKCDFPWSAVTNDAGNETGEIEFKFKMVARIETKDGRTIEQRPILFDAKQRPMNDRIGGGSILRVGFEPHLWYVPATGVGLSLRLKAVQVIELRESGGRGAADFGFAEEEGFETAFTVDAEDGSQF